MVNTLSKPRKFLVLVAALALALVLIQAITVQEGHAAYQDGRLIDNGPFLDAQSMSASHIQSFLQSKSGQLKNRSFKLDCDAPGIGNTAKQLYLSIGAPCGSTIPASHIIYYSAQIYGVSPKVILATLQKEQSLITNPSPGNWEFNQAMGYNCPTSGHCDDNSGFFYQIDNGTWVLRFHYERARGNNTWWNNNGWTCGTAKPSFYTPNLYPQQNVNFIDPYSGIHYKTVYLHNAATSALYCYTPHVFNNHHNSPHPNEPKGGQRCYSIHPLSGDRGRCYTGSINFVNSYELWFGSTYTPSYAAQAVGQSYYPTLKQGESAPAYFLFKNTGSNEWYDEASAWPAGRLPVRLGTTNPHNRNSIFGSQWQFGRSRPAVYFSAVYEADGTTLAANQHVVQPGQIARFSFNFVAPSNAPLGFYNEAFIPLVEGYGAMNSSGAWLGVTVQQTQYTAQGVGQSYYPTIRQGESAEVYLRYKNTGNVAWYDEASAWPAGRLPVRLGTDSAPNRSSVFGKGWHFGPSRAAAYFHKVYEANGTTLAGNQHVAQPGQIVEFRFRLTTQLNTPPGFYAEGFRPLVEGRSAMNPTGTWLGVTVTSANFSAQAVGQSYYPTIKRGQSAPAYFLFKNTGNVAWYDEASAWPAGRLPVRLGTTNPHNRNSIFGSQWQFGRSRPAVYFSAVYEADGTTLAANQHVVQPGQIARFSFNFVAPSNAPLGFYNEAFIPLVEGYGAMNSSGAWLGVTVSP